MTIASNLQRIIDAKAAIKAAIIEKGVEVPDTEKLDTYYTYIDQIGAGPGIFEPDLSQPLDQAQLDNLQNIVSAGKASEYLSLGDELLVSYGDYIMPFEVVGFEDVEVEGGETVPAINLLAKYTSEVDSQWGANGSVKYSASTLRSYMTTTYQGKLDANFVACLANTKKQTYSRDGSTDVVYDKFFAPSMAQLGVVNASYNTAQQAAVEGPAFTAYQGAADAKRVKCAINATTTAQNYWTSSLYSGDSNSFGLVQTSGAPDSYIYFVTYRVVAACNFIGTKS